ncbi:MAG TPA: helix-turn-helix transcriptional regulator [Chitinophagaceae bacterium]
MSHDIKQRESVSLWKMRKIETIEEFYKRKFEWVPQDIRSDIGHFNVFKLDPFVGTNAKPVPYSRRDYFKIMLAIGNSKVHYADEVIKVKKQALSFSNPQIPYKWEHTDRIRSGLFCVFTPAFFHQYGNLNQYDVFQPGGTHVFELTDEQVNKVTAVYERMFEEINSTYKHKYDALRNLTFELIHFAMKLQPTERFESPHTNASDRISAFFLELLERQFPIDDTHQSLSLRSPADFAKQLHIHVNHLNRAIKETTEKTTSQIIAERILQESKVLLRHSAWNISEIAFSLGFKEVTHFDNFFKKHVKVSPLKFRNVSDSL